MEAVTAQRTHPLIIVAAVSVTALSLAGIGAIFGVIPGSGDKAPATEIQAASVAAAPPAAAAPAALAAAPEAAPPARATAATTLSLPAGSSVRIETPADKPRRSEPVARAAKPEAKKEAVHGEAPSAAPSGYTRVANDEAPSVYAERAPRPLPPVEAPAVAAPTCRECGTIADIREIKKAGDANGIGAVAGGLLGGIVGRQVGGGRGRDAMTVIGAVGGAVAGHQVEKNQRSTAAYEVTVRFDDGTTQVVPSETAPSWRPGDRVRVSGGQLSHL